MLGCAAACKAVRDPEGTPGNRRAGPKWHPQSASRLPACHNICIPPGSGAYGAAAGSRISSPLHPKKITHSPTGRIHTSEFLKRGVPDGANSWTTGCVHFGRGLVADGLPKPELADTGHTVRAFRATRSGLELSIFGFAVIEKASESCASRKDER